jgi:hypothetical protein
MAEVEMFDPRKLHRALAYTNAKNENEEIMNKLSFSLFSLTHNYVDFVLVI